jgi:hypothetical protein
MTKINNLFFFYVLICIGFGVGNVYWNERYTHYIFIGISMLIGLFMFFSKYFYTKESYEFFRKQVFLTSLIFLFSIFVRSDSNIYKVIDLSIFNAYIGALMLWIFTIKYRSGENNKGKDLPKTGHGPTLA